MPITVPPKIFPGRAHKDNKGAIDWGRQNLLAYGCQSYIVVIDPSSQSIVQTLDEHRSPVVSVKWCPDNIVSDLDKPSKLRLASGDKTGSIIIWNVLEATIITTITEPTLKSVLDMKWIVRNDNYYLLVLNSPSALVLWNITTNTKIWRIDFNDPLSWFELNPFDTTHLILASNSGLIYFINDFTLENKKPVQVELKYTISSNRSSNKSNNSDFQQVIFSPAARNVCYFLLSREIIIFDLTIHQAIGSLVLDRSRGSFTNLLTFQEEPNLFICIHEDATLSAWLRKKSDFKFELECYSDIIRFNKHSKKKGLNIVSICNNPNKESLIASITNDGSVWIWEYMYSNPNTRTLTSSTSTSTSTAKDQKFSVIALIEHISSSISSLCVSPFTEEHESLIALGSYHGTIQIVDMLKSVTSYEFLLWNQPVRGVRWASPNTLMAFNCEEVSKSEFKNRLTILDIKTGKQQEIRKVNGTENTFIRAVRISSSRQYFIVLLKDKPFELWDMKSLSLLRTMKPFSQITSLEWAPIKGDATSTNKEQFVFTLPDGSIRYFSVFNGIVTPIEMTADLGMGVISSLAWKEDILVSGDTVGTLHVWNLATKKSSAYATNKGLIRRIRFAPTSKQIIVLYNEGDIAIWDLEHGVRLAVSNYLKGRDLKAIDCDWITDNTPIVATTDGCVRILDRSLSTSNYSYLFNSENIPVFTPYLLPYSQALNIKVVLQHLSSENTFIYSPTTSDIPNDKNNNNSNAVVAFNEESLLKYVDPTVVSKIISKNSIQSKCLEVSNYFGNVEESQFWTLVQFSFEKYQHKKGGLKSQNIPTPNTSNDTLDLSNLTSQTLPESGTTIVTNNTSSPSSKSLPLYFDLLLENGVIRKMELERASIQETKKSGYELTKKIADFNILLGQKTKAIDLLLETPRDNPNFYRDALKAAVIAATVSPDTFKNTIKLLATDFIANGNIDEGVQLLCIIGKSFDACRHLQTYDRFTDSVWLAKISLSENESFQIMKSWSNFLNMTNHKIKAINILVTLGEFEQVIQSLYDSKMIELAALFVQACLKENYLSIQLENKSESLTPFEQIVQSIYLDYGLYLHRLGNNKAAEYYWKQAGPSGRTILETRRNSTKTSTPQ